MTVSRKTRRLVYLASAAITLFLRWPVELGLVAAIGNAVGESLLAWGIPALALWLATRKRDTTGLGPFIAPTLLWLVFFAAHVLQQVQR
jgi:hypothetical protein